MLEFSEAEADLFETIKKMMLTGADIAIVTRERPGEMHAYPIVEGPEQGIGE